MPLHRLQTEWDADLRGGDPLGFPGYGGAPDRESVMTGRTEHYAVIEGCFDVLGGSMGAVHGERVVRAYRRAVEERLPMVVLTESGGARMQEGMVALIQMARCAAAARRHADAGLLSAAVYRSPTTGGVYASYGSLCDIRAAVTGATVGFAGPRVVEMTTGQRLPATSHTAESALGAGLIDAVIDEGEQAAWVERALGLRRSSDETIHWVVPRVPPEQGAWGEVLRSRLGPSGESWVELLVEDRLWLRGGLGGLGGIVGGLAFAGDQRLAFLATGRDLARPGPADYRFAQRVVALAARIGLPVLTIVDTPGADPGPKSEQGGVAGEIARTLAAFDALPTRSVCLCVGEGGSGGALALAHTDALLILEHGIFSVISPEGAAAILERDPAKAPELADHLKLTSTDLLALGVVDAVVEGDPGHVRSAVRNALRSAEVGARRERIDAATARWLR